MQLQPACMRCLADVHCHWVQTLTYPLDLVRRRMQVQALAAAGAPKLGNTWSALRAIAASQGWRGLFNGLSINYMKARSLCMKAEFETNGVHFISIRFWSLCACALLAAARAWIGTEHVAERICSNVRC